MASSFRFLPGIAAGLCVSFAALAQQAPPKPPPAPAKPAPSAQPAGPADPVVITVGTQQIRASQFDALIKAAPQENQAAMLANKREVAEELTKMMALTQEAQRRGMDKDPMFVAKMMMARDNALASSVVDILRTEDKPTDAQIAAYYAANPTKFVSTKVRHILVGDSETPNGPNPRSQAEAQAKAQALEARLQKGEDFATIAKAESDDPGSKDKGGELGDVQPGQTVPEFDAAIATLPVGKVSDPIHTQFGYHIIEVESRTPMPMAQATPLISDQLLGDRVNAAIDKLTAATNPVISPSFFGPPPPVAPAAIPHK